MTQLSVIGFRLSVYCNAVDESYRSQLKEINELNWERFRAELRVGLAGQRAELIKWMFGFWIAFWIAAVLPLGGLILR